MPRTLLAFLIALGIAVPSWAAASHVEVLVSEPDRTVLRFDTGDFDLADVNVDGTIWSAIVWDGGERSLDRGSPALPAFRESIVIPDDAKMQITVISSEYVDQPNVRIVPSKGPITRDVLPQDVSWEFGDVYQADAFYPAEIAGLGDPYILRDVRGTVVTVAPFQWNPVTETLRAYTSVEVEVKTVGRGETNVLTYRPAERVSEFETIYAEHFLNYGSALTYTPVGEAGCMVVIAHDAFAEAVQPLVDSRRGRPSRSLPGSPTGRSCSNRGR
jgi:gingipain R